MYFDISKVNFSTRRHIDAALIRERLSHFVNRCRMRFKQPLGRRNRTLDATACARCERFARTLDSAG